MDGMTDSFNNYRVAITNRLDTAQDRDLISASTRDAITGALERIERTMSDFEDDRSDIQASTLLSEAGRNQQIADLYNQMHRYLVGAVNDIHETIDTVLSVEKRAATPTLDDMTPELFEARAANARTDLRMVLDAVAPRDVPEKLAHYAQRGDATMRHLILATEWPAMYIETRGDEGAAPLWASKRRELLPLVLNARGQRAMQRLLAEDELHQVLSIATFIVDAWAKDAMPHGRTTPNPRGN